MSRWILVSVLSLIASAGTAGETLSDTRRAELHDLLIQDCGSCHGLTLHGGLGPALLPQRLQPMPREALINTVLNGRAGTAMPPWSPLLSRDEAAWLVDQLRHGVSTP